MAWASTIDLRDVWKDPARTFEQRRDEIARRLRASRWVMRCEGVEVLPYLVDELADAQDADAFDSAWSAIYDEADADRVWIELGVRG